MYYDSDYVSSKPNIWMKSETVCQLDQNVHVQDKHLNDLVEYSLFIWIGTTYDLHYNGGLITEMKMSLIL